MALMVGRPLLLYLLKITARYHREALEATAVQIRYPVDMVRLKVAEDISLATTAVTFQLISHNQAQVLLHFLESSISLVLFSLQLDSFGELILWLITVVYFRGHTDHF